MESLRLFSMSFKESLLTRMRKQLLGLWLCRISMPKCSSFRGEGYGGCSFNPLEFPLLSKGLRAYAPNSGKEEIH